MVWWLPNAPFRDGKTKRTLGAVSAKPKCTPLWSADEDDGSVRLMVVRVSSVVEMMMVRRCTNVGDIGISTIAEALSTSLRTLKLLDGYKLGDKSISAVANLCKKPTFALSFGSYSNGSGVVAVESNVVVLSLQDGVKLVEQHVSKKVVTLLLALSSVDN
ncbi:hypothetical protein Tco_0401259 [Tanacetum coccineum]